MNRLTAAALGSVLLALSPVSAQAQGSDADAAIGLADQFFACAGFFRAMSEASRALVMTADDQDYYRGLGRGAEIAGTMVWASITDPKVAWDQAPERAETERIYWANLWNSAGSGDEPAGAALKLQVGTCADLNPIQAELVKEARKRAYLSAE